jgi:hypothetical protein
MGNSLVFASVSRAYSSTANDLRNSYSRPRFAGSNSGTAAGDSTDIFVERWAGFVGPSRSEKADDFQWVHGEGWCQAGCNVMHGCDGTHGFFVILVAGIYI